MEPNSQPDKNRNLPPDEKPRQASIHTLEGDIFTAIKDDNYANNIVKIVTDPKANINKSQSAAAETNSFLKKIILASVIVVVLFLGVLGYFYFTGNNPNASDPNNPNANATNGFSSTTQPAIKPTVLETEAILALDIKGLDKNAGIQKIRQIQQDLRDKKIAAGTTVELSLNLTTPELFAKNQYSGGEGLLRALTSAYSFGLYNNQNNKFESFLIFQVSSSDLAFSNMLAWERYLPSDLEALFTDASIAKTPTIEQGTSTATTTATTTPTRVPPQFTDRVLRNTDSRVYTDEYGRVKFVYGFINKEYLIISGGVESFIDVKTRLLNDNTLR